ncbi:MAG: hypothetical protein ACHQ17_06590, partial [Polyangia bacterium]
RHLDYITAHTPPKKLVHELRKAVAWYTKGLRDSAHVREQAFHVLDPAQVREIASAYFSERCSSLARENIFPPRAAEDVDKVRREVA